MNGTPHRQCLAFVTTHGTPRRRVRYNDHLGNPPQKPILCASHKPPRCSCAAAQLRCCCCLRLLRCCCATAAAALQLAAAGCCAAADCCAAASLQLAEVCYYLLLFDAALLLLFAAAAACCWLLLRCCCSAAGIGLGWAPHHQPSAAAQRPTAAHTIRGATLYGRLIGRRLILIGWAHPISGATL